MAAPSAPGGGSAPQGPVGLELHRVSARRRSFHLEISDLRLPPGITVLAGPNGAGKSTFFRCLAAREPRALVEGTLDGAPLTGHDVTVMAQSPRLPRDLTPRELLEQVAWLSGSDRTSASERAGAVLDDVGLGDVAARRIDDLSGGMSRRLAYGASRVLDASLVLLDEPTNDLDPVQRRSFLRLVEETSAGRTCVIATHALRDVAPIADHVMVLDGGRVLFSGTTEAFLDGYAPESRDAEDAYTRCIDTAGALA